jgi:hypothetical protein
MVRGRRSVVSHEEVPGSAPHGSMLPALEELSGLVGTRYSWTTPEIEARVVEAIEQRLTIALKIAEG